MRNLTKAQVRAIVEQVGYTGELLEQMTDIAWRESHGDPDARARMDNGRGLFQIDVRWAPKLIAEGIIESRNEMFDPVKNALCARYIEQQVGIHAWPALREFPAPPE